MSIPPPPGCPRMLPFLRAWQRNELKNPLCGMAGQLGVSREMWMTGTIPSLLDPERWRLWCEANGGSSPLVASTQLTPCCSPPRSGRRHDLSWARVVCRPVMSSPSHSGEDGDSTEHSPKRGQGGQLMGWIWGCPSALVGGGSSGLLC